MWSRRLGATKAERWIRSICDDSTRVRSIHVLRAVGIEKKREIRKSREEREREREGVCVCGGGGV